MDDSAAAIGPSSAPPRPVVVVDPRGDVILDVYWHAASTAAVKAATSSTASTAFRVDAATLRQYSRYFANLLGDTRFCEAQAVEKALAALALDGVAAGDCRPERLPWVRIEDDEADGERGRVARARVFGELLWMLHGGGEADGTAAIQTAPADVKGKTPWQSRVKTGKPVIKPVTKPAGKTATTAKTIPSKTTPVKTTDVQDPVPASSPSTHWSSRQPPTLRDVAILARQADRFDCAAALARPVRALHLRFPQPVVRAVREDDDTGGSFILGAPATPSSAGLPSLANEEAIRQKIYIGWRLDQPVHFDRGTRELILYGSRRWTAAAVDYVANAADDDDDDDAVDPWWNLPDGLEAELRRRRAAILRCLASVPRHFLARYVAARRHRVCPLGYGSSAACDSFQLGEMVRFLCQRGLLALSVGAPGHDDDDDDDDEAAEADSETSGWLTSPFGRPCDLHHILAILRQCPAYQLDRDHVHCGLRTRLLPILDYIQTLLAAPTVAVRHREWRAAGQRGASNPSWAVSVAAADNDYDYGAQACVFRFTRAVAADQRLRYEGNMAADRFARALFTARRWDWTPED